MSPCRERSGDANRWRGSAHAMTHRALPLLLLLAGAPLLTGCPLPIAGSVTRSAPVVGRVIRADGRPASGLDVALSTDWSDTECGKVALRARADSSGVFQFPKIEHHYSTTWVVPNLDRATPQFSLCATVSEFSAPPTPATDRLAPAADPTRSLASSGNSPTPRESTVPVAHSADSPLVDTGSTHRVRVLRASTASSSPNSRQ